MAIVAFIGKLLDRKWGRVREREREREGKDMQQRAPSWDSNQGRLRSEA